MTTFERSAIGIVGLMTVALIGVTLARPPAGVTAAPDARLGEAPRAAPKKISAPARVRDSRGIFAAAERLPLKSTPRTFMINASHPTTSKVADVFDNLGYDLQSVKSGQGRVPRLFLASLPGDLAKVRQIKRRKVIFFKSVLPLILQANEETLADRKRLWDLRTRIGLGQRVAAADRLWLIVIAERYGTKQGDLDELLRRVDVVSPSLALAQAAVESGWGTSRFVREGNAMFGEWTFSSAGGLTPLQRDEGKTHAIRAFPSLLGSVRAYARNLNTHRAYRKFRGLRADMRQAGKPMDGMVLAAGLLSYSERGVEYVETIRSIIDANNLRRLDDARLRDGEPAPLI